MCDRRCAMALGARRSRPKMAERVSLFGDGDVQLHRIYAGAEKLLPPAALEHAVKQLDQRRIHVLDALGALEVCSAVQVLAVEQGDEFGMLEVVVPGEGDQPADRLHGLHLVQMQLLLGLANVGVGALEHGQEQVVLAAEVVIDQPLVETGARGDAVHPGAGQAALCKLVAGRVEDRELRSIGIARAGFDGRSRRRLHGVQCNQLGN
jgi:hypothetical protein